MEWLVIWFKQNTSDIILGIFFFIVGILFDLIMAHVFRVKKQLSVEIENTEIVRKNEEYPEGLNINYLGKAVSCLSIANYHIWNSGNTTIPKESISTKDQLRCESSDASIFILNIINPGRAGCGIDIRSKPNIADIHFEFLDRNDGVTFSIMHDSLDTPIIAGVLAGTEIKIYKGKTYQRIKGKYTIYAQITALLIQLVMCIAAILFLIISGNLTLCLPVLAVIVLFIVSLRSFINNK